MDSLFQLFWLFIIFSAITPYIQQRALDANRARRLEKLEKRNGSRAITLIHRQESMSLLGIPVSRYISVDDSEAVLRAIRMTDPDIPLELILHTPGGLVLAAEQIAEALLKHPAMVTVYVPHYAMSGGTLIALAANRIVMDPNAVLGPVDPQIGNYPAASVLSVLERKSADRIDDETYILADIATKAQRQVKATVSMLLEHKGWDESRVEDVATLLTSGTWTHDYPIDVEQARGFGLEIDTAMPKEVYDLIELYPQANNKKPSVQYVPMPYRRDGERTGERDQA